MNIVAGSDGSSASVLVKTETHNDVVRDEGTKGSEKALGYSVFLPHDFFLFFCLFLDFDFLNFF